MKHANNESDLAVSARRSRIQIKKRILILMQMKIQLKGPGGVDRQTDARREARKCTAEQMNKGTLTEGGEREGTGAGSLGITMHLTHSEARGLSLQRSYRRRQGG